MFTPAVAVSAGSGVCQYFCGGGMLTSRLLADIARIVVPKACRRYIGNIRHGIQSDCDIALKDSHCMQAQHSSEQ